MGQFLAMTINPSSEYLEHNLVGEEVEVVHGVRGHLVMCLGVGCGKSHSLIQMTARAEGSVR